MVKAKEDGLDQVTDEEKKTVEDNTKAYFDSVYSEQTQLVTDEGELTGEALADEIKTRYNKDLEERGFTEEYVKDRYTTSLIVGKVQEKYDATIKPTDEQLKAMYDEQVEAEKEA